MRKATGGIIRAVLGCAVCAAVISASGCTCAGTAAGDSAAQNGSQSVQTGNSTENSSGTQTDIGMPETVIVDEAQCAFAVTSVDPEGSFGYTVNVRCENRSDRTLMFSWDECAVNGWAVDPFWAEEVSAGNRANSRIVFSRDELERCGIQSVDEISFELRVYDSDDWTADDVAEAEFAIYPTGLNPSQVRIPARTPKEGEYSVVDSSRCAFIIESADPDGIMGYTLTCYLENRTDDDLMFSWDDVAVNGMMTDPFWAAEVEAQKRAYSQITFVDSEFEESGIESVEQIEFRLRIYDADDWDETPEVDGVFVYTPKKSGDAAERHVPLHPR